jgi:nucleoside-diphosphate-sugar epimerase
MAVLVVGASGFIGKALVERLLSQGVKVYALSRHPLEARGNLVPVTGDVLSPNLGVDAAPDDIEAVYHLASIVRLGKDKDRSIWNTNVNGTKGVISFCRKNKIPHLYYISTAFLNGSNPYELSKAWAEYLVRKSGIEKITIFKPSIVMGASEEHFFPGHYSQWALMVVRVHKRAEIIRRKIEGTLHLPVLEPVLRVKGDPDAPLNIVPVEQVADSMARIKDTGTFWLTHPSPPTVGQITSWIGDFALVRVSVIKEPFKATPIEAAFERMSSAFTLYLFGQEFHSDIEECPLVTKDDINGSILRAFLAQG